MAKKKVEPKEFLITMVTRSVLENVVVDGSPLSEWVDDNGEEHWEATVRAGVTEGLDLYLMHFSLSNNRKKRSVSDRQ